MIRKPGLPVLPFIIIIIINIQIIETLKYVVCVCLCMGTAKQRKERLKILEEIVKENGGSMYVSELYAKVSLEWGVSRRTFEDYVATLVNAKRFVRPYLIRGDYKITHFDFYDETN